MNKLINIIDTTSNTRTTIKNKIDLKLQQQKQKLAIDYFQKNEYLQNYIQHFYDNFNDSFIDESGFLCRFNDFDFTQIPDTLKEQLNGFIKEYNLHTHGTPSGASTPPAVPSVTNISLNISSSKSDTLHIP